MGMRGIVYGILFAAVLWLLIYMAFDGLGIPGIVALGACFLFAFLLISVLSDVEDKDKVE